ncbi:MAG: WYL domain-containing protein [Prevotella sp.]|nr:WYL domain-containing protein [Prevotella sp.]
MPINRNALLRYKTIDRMLKGGRQATLEELIDACSDALHDYNGHGDVSKRTIQNDIQEMRYSQALGYHAPIVVVDRKYYTYRDRRYSIMQMPVSKDDLMQLSEAVGLLKQMSSFQGFNEVDDVVNRLEDHVASMRYQVEPIIFLENNNRLKGLEYITPLHDAIMAQKVIKVTYMTFKSEEPVTFSFSPYILKEFRNRWFVFGKRHDTPDRFIFNLALDRIEHITDAPKKEKYRTDKAFHPHSYFKNMIGVSRDFDSPVEHIVFEATPAQAPYNITKPLHDSQKVIERRDDGSVVFSIDVIVNYELERDLLGFGEGITVLSPSSLVERLKERLKKCIENYKKM